MEGPVVPKKAFLRVVRGVKLKQASRYGEHEPRSYRAFLVETWHMPRHALSFADSDTTYILSSYSRLGPCGPHAAPLLHKQMQRLL